MYITHPSAKGHLLRFCGEIGGHDTGCHRGNTIGFSSILDLRQKQGVREYYTIIGRKINIVPQTHVPTTNGGNPIPSDRGMKRRIIGSENATIEVGVHLVFLLHPTKIRIIDDTDGKHVGAFTQPLRHFKTPTNESTVHPSDIVAVEPNLGFPIDAVETKHHAGMRQQLVGNLELCAIDERLAEKRLGNHHQVVVEVGIGNGLYIYIACKNCGGHGGYDAAERLGLATIGH